MGKVKEFSKVLSFYNYETDTYKWIDVHTYSDGEMHTHTHIWQVFDNLSINPIAKNSVTPKQI